MKRSKFSLSHYNLLTCDMGELIPLTWYEVLPGDTIQHSTSMLLRVLPLVAPIMHPVRIRIHHWFVPNRLLYEDWEEYITGGEDGMSAAIHPQIVITNPSKGTLADYLGVPPGTYEKFFNALPFRAYAKIYNEAYRDQDLQSEVGLDLGGGPSESVTNTSLLKVAWEKDYFTTARPEPVKGPDLYIPLGDKAPVTGIGKVNQNFDYSSGAANETGGGSPTYASYAKIDEATANDRWRVEEDPDNAGYPGIYADLSEATGISISDLREYLALQRYQEARARFGSRYSEYLRYLVPGLKPSDARLQEPEYLGGGRNVISFSEILQSESSDATTPQGTMTGHGISAMRTRRFRRFFEEHGIVMSLMSVVPKAIYTQGLFRKWQRQTKEAYFQKELQFIGEQEILNEEVYVETADWGGTFGYQHRYDEYRYHPSTVHGDFHDTLDHWHMGRQFASEPALNSTFITANPTDRVYAQTSTDNLLVMANHSIQARRILSKWSTPKTF